MTHFAKVDWWLATLLGGIVIFEFGTAISVVVASVTTGSPPLREATGIALVLAGSGVLLGLALWACYRIRYEVSPPNLVIRFGPFRASVPLHSIVEVFPSRNPLSSPAPSLDRLRINYRRENGKLRFALISPKDKEGFVRDLSGAAPQLRSTMQAPLRFKAEGSA
jgi:hypothetical protein